MSTKIAGLIVFAQIGALCWLVPKVFLTVYSSWLCAFCGGVILVYLYLVPQRVSQGEMASYVAGVVFAFIIISGSSLFTATITSLIFGILAKLFLKYFNAETCEFESPLQ